MLYEIIHVNCAQSKGRCNLTEYYLYLIHEKSRSLYIFKSFKAKVEFELGKKIKAVKSDHGGEYYGRYDRSGEQRCQLKQLTKPLMNFGLVPSIKHLHIWGCPAEA
ncbi:hypothetical protein CR513_07555, partial [Mucuna pruriens]